MSQPPESMSLVACLRRSARIPSCRIRQPLAMTVACLLGALAWPGATGATPGPAQTKWYLAEGATGIFDTEILIANPHDVEVDVRITWGLPAGTAAVEPTTITMAPTSRKTVRVQTLDGLSSTAVSALVESLGRNGQPPLPIVVERSMYWRHQGLPKGHNSVGVLEPATTWYLAEGATGDFRNFILIYNPDADPTVEAVVELTFLREGLPPVGPIERRVKGGERANVFVNTDVAELASAAFSTRIVSKNDVPIIVERAMYFPAGSDPFLGRVGHESAGITAPATRWVFGEGVAGDVGVTIFDTFLLLANPAGTTANVTVIYSKEDGTRYEQTVAVDGVAGLPPNARKTIWVNFDVPGFDSGAFSMEVLSDTPILAERAVYWGTGTPAGWVEAHNSPGATEEALAWGFAEGLDGGFDMSGLLYQSFFLVANTDTEKSLDIKVTFLREDGTGFVKRYEGATAIMPASRFTISSWQLPELSNQRFATFIESLNDVPFVAERAVYWGAGFIGGHNSLGAPWSGPVATPPAMPDPAATSVAPASANTAGGIAITITGTNFAFPVTVTIGGTPATNVLVWNATTITAVAPPGTTGAKDVVVTSRGITSTLPGAFTYTQPPAPEVTSLSVITGPTYGGTTVIITGLNFTPTMTVNFGGLPVTNFVYRSETRVDVDTPARAGGATFVQVSNQFGTSTTAGNAFTYVKATATDNILAFGDSITYGVYSVLDPTTGTINRVFPASGTDPNTYPMRLRTRLSATYPAQAIAVTNAGEPGEGVRVNGFGPTIGIERIRVALQPPQDLVIILQGYNDISAGETGTSIVNGLRSMVADVRAQGKYVIVCSLTPIKPDALEGNYPAPLSQVTNVSNAIGGLVPTWNAEFEGGVYFVDMFNQMPASAISPDGLHPSAGGYDLMALLLHNFIEANFETVSPPVP